MGHDPQIPHTTKFPSFYAQCAYTDGRCNGEDGHSNSLSAYIKWGKIDPVAQLWYWRGHRTGLAMRDGARAAA